ncbi:surface antigen BspA-like [Trichomonas vaginalis G3]|uniref:Surface antigen BspA-like n=1 Tax=Trichomonas vaginalis (strain ATCC PRA-98 / G3) TaxID=412133 RepID=A2EHF8_TRIV3|nr:leucine-rich repeats (6 copies)-containing protein [Trichomonas vaginalis G3]EAY07936.1 surface antigen BspA-like [Trichomonas vaginalis G3]KAI5531246.1 leucine-rich repeats (6 copies)-containing protein [Trichomonas vaginalis G3]|eukprot:XP_001320159.1 surface antigen BspA-like [Trichomonas vaginalis G3]
MSGDYEISQTAFENDILLANIEFHSNKFDILDFNGLHHQIKQVTFESDKIKELPSLSKLVELDKININFCNGSVSILSNFVSNSNLFIYIYDNIESINETAFAHAGIQQIKYCGNRKIQGNFLEKAKKVDVIQTSKNYSSSKFGGLKITQKVNNCPALPNPDYDPSKEKTKKIIIIVCVPIVCLIAAGILIVIFRQLSNKRRQRTIDERLILEKAISDDFG